MKRQHGFFLLFFVASLCGYHFAASQDLSGKKWYFGNSQAGITFDRPNYTSSQVNDQATPFDMGGSAVATDPTSGSLLFYTDGNRVYDASHNVMPNGTNLNASHVPTPYEQPVAISAVPGQEGKYYIFTSSGSINTGGKTISVSVVDMSLSGNATANNPPLGDVASSNALIGLTNRSEGMITVPHSDGTRCWLITQEVQSKNYSATLIQATMPFSSISSNGIGSDVNVARMTYCPTNDKIAMAVLAPTDSAFIVDFDNSTGKITFDRDIPNAPSFGSLPTHDVSALEWSLSGQYLYLSTYGNNGTTTGDVLQYDYDNPLSPLTSVLTAPVYGSYGLQIASDTAIYHLYRTSNNGSIMVGRLTQIDTTAANVQYESTPFGNTDFMGFLFPAFLPQKKVDIKVSFTASSSTCQNEPITFLATVTPGADSLVWDFGDGSKESGFSFTKTYSQAQTYTVSLTAYYRKEKKEVTQSVTVSPFSLSLQLVSDTTACRSEFPPPRGSGTPQPFAVKANVQGGTPASAIWSNGDTGTTLTPDSAGYYYLVVSDASGCSTYAGVNVKEYKLIDQHTNVWYFGNNAGIDFNPIPTSPPLALDDGAMNAPEGTATMSDRNGDVMFYTDGNKVYDKTHTEIATGIGGDSASAQSALIVPVKGHEELYYIFTTKAMDVGPKYELRYSLFDLKQNSGKGAVVIKNVLLYSQSTERIVANGSWLISHEYGNNTFRAYPLTEKGVGVPVFSDIGSVHSLTSRQTGEGYMALSSNNRIAVALSNPGVSNIVEVFNLDSIGHISNYVPIDLNDPNGQVYGVVFSPGGNKLFATLRGNTSTVYEYYFDTMGSPVQLNTESNTAGELGAMQIGPDGKIYIAIDGSTQLGTILPNERNMQQSTVSFAGFSLATGTQSSLGLPNFIQFVSNSPTDPNISVDGFCLGDTTFFTGVATDAIDEFAWTLGDGTIKNSSSPSHVYSQLGTYTITMHLTNRCGLDTTLTTSITIVPAAITPTIPSTAALCQDVDSVVLDANANNLPGYTYLWSTNDTTKTLRLDHPAEVSVTTTNAEGCMATAKTFVADNRPMIALPPDTTMCANAIPTEVSTPNMNGNYAWKINGKDAGTDRIQPVDRSVAGVDLYQLTITDPITGCFRKDTVIITILNSPLSADFEQSDACLPTVSLTAKPVGNYTYKWYKDGALQTALLGSTVTLGLSEDGSNYSVEISNTATGCLRKSEPKKVEVVGVISVILNLSKACNDGQPFTLTATTNTLDVNYQWFFNNSPIPNTNIDTTSQFSEGTYRVDVSKSTCTVSADTVVSRLPIPSKVELPGKEVICDYPQKTSFQTAEVTLDPGKYDQYEWFKDDAPLNVTTRTFTANSIGTYKVVVTNTHNCTNSGQTEVISDCIPIIEAPTAFRPGSQHTSNKVFSLFTFFITDEFSIFIYNRWGELIYQSNDRFFTWNGTHQKTGESAPEGLYAYVIKYIIYSRPDRGMQEKRGSVTLIR